MSYYASVEAAQDRRREIDRLLDDAGVYADVIEDAIGKVNRGEAHHVSPAALAETWGWLRKLDRLASGEGAKGGR